MSSFSHLAVGSELTLGQILNTSSQWLSQIGDEIGLNCQYHVTVSDNRQELENAALFLSSVSHLIIVTGGLGPTCDDFTRDIIAKVTNKPLTWSDEAWNNLCDYLVKRQSKVREAHKQECYFPTDSVLFPNPIGTACGFAVKTKHNIWIALPGPPREMQAMWEAQIRPYLLSHVPILRPHMTWSTYIFGVPESGVAELLAPDLKGCPYEVGYRIHLPYVEFKIRFFKDEHNQAQRWIERVKQRLIRHKTISDPQLLIEQVWLSLTNYLDPLPESLYILNPDNRSELALRFQGDSPLKIIILSLRYHELTIPPPHLALEWKFNLDDGTVMVELYQESCVPLKTISCLSPLSLNYSAERRVKDLIERALFELSSVSL